jgi:hypothetical protein
VHDTALKRMKIERRVIEWPNLILHAESNYFGDDVSGYVNRQRLHFAELENKLEKRHLP